MSKQTAYVFKGNAEVRDVPMAILTWWWQTASSATSSSRASRAFPSLIMGMLKDSLRSSRRARAGALMMRPALRSLKNRMDYKSHGGAPLLGVNGAVVKAHGSSDARGDQKRRAARRAPCWKARS